MMDSLHPPQQTERRRSEILLPSPSEFPISPLSSRRSLNPRARRPLRSSPLAGPVLSNDGAVKSVDQAEADHGSHLKPRYKPSRISSTPNIGLLDLLSHSSEATEPNPYSNDDHASSSLLRVPSSSTRRLSSSAPSSLSKRTSKTFDANGGNIDGPHDVTSEIPQENFIVEPSKLISKLTPLPSTSSSAGPAAVPHSHSPLLEVPTKTPPSSPRLRSRHALPRDPSLPLLEVPTANPPSSPRPRSRYALSRDPSENWMTSNTYDETPRFSRLGLASSNVVLPVSAREHRRLSRSNSLASVKSVASTATHAGRSRPLSILGLSPLLDETVTEDQTPPSLTTTRKTSLSGSERSADPDRAPAHRPRRVSSATHVQHKQTQYVKQQDGMSPARSRSLGGRLSRLSIRSKSNPNLLRNRNRSPAPPVPRLEPPKNRSETKLSGETRVESLEEPRKLESSLDDPQVQKKSRLLGRIWLSISAMHRRITGKAPSLLS